MVPAQPANMVPAQAANMVPAQSANMIPAAGRPHVRAPSPQVSPDLALKLRALPLPLSLTPRDPLHSPLYGMDHSPLMCQDTHRQ